ncbi:hypothetical protein ABZU53_11135 [Micromonospora sp. NPDC005194]|uniref:hypothetical protein n=1 Tax=Micromonospora sp. NPDC005194 TaxID=3156870 RepID=UPI00339E8C49
MDVLIPLFTLCCGFVLGRLYQWLKDELRADLLPSHDCAEQLHAASADIRGQVRQAEWQIRRATSSGSAR